MNFPQPRVSTDTTPAQTERTPSPFKSETTGPTINQLIKQGYLSPMTTNLPVPFKPEAIAGLTKPQILTALKINSSNSQFNVSVTGDSRSTINIYIGDHLVATEKVSRRAPFKYLKTLNRSQHIESIRKQLAPYHISLTDIGLNDYKLKQL